MEYRRNKNERTEAVMKIKRVKPRSKRVASALQFTNLTDQQAEKLYRSFYDCLRADWPQMARQERPRFIVLEGGRK